MTDLRVGDLVVLRGEAQDTHLYSSPDPGSEDHTTRGTITPREIGLIVATRDAVGHLSESIRLVTSQGVMGWIWPGMVQKIPPAENHTSDRTRS